nr:hypothetical protein [Tanacetum cinerariifolium]
MKIEENKGWRVGGFGKENKDTFGRKKFREFELGLEIHLILLLAWTLSGSSLSLMSKCSTFSFLFQEVIGALAVPIVHWYDSRLESTSASAGTIVPLRIPLVVKWMNSGYLRVTSGCAGLL